MQKKLSYNTFYTNSHVLKTLQVRLETFYYIIKIYYTQCNFQNIYYIVT